ncbi:penicillin-binding protein 2 [Alkalibacterium iburiense]|uniref:Penicillin-binding protein 2 n=1 Tax=Alkalibacterium iburiense TaxID=290589 RepID=A0ABN0XN09_9LACT
MKRPSQNRKDKKKSHIPFRLNLLFFVVFLLFASLILRLGYLQIIRADEYQAEVDRTERTTITGSVPRGEIFDANLRRLVGNEARNTITYTRGRNVPASQMAEVAYNLAEYIEMDTATPFNADRQFDLTIRDLKDYVIATNQEDIRERLTSEELRLSGNESYQAMLDSVSEDEISSLPQRDLTAAAIFKKMNSAYSLSTVNVKNENVSQEEIARVSENLDSLPGIGTGTDWVRIYPEGDMLRSILGNVSSEDQGLPANKLKTYLAKGYSRNDRVGTTLLESQYEEVLSGTKSRLETETNTNGDIINQIEQYQGNKGDNLILTIDIEFQETVEQIAKESLALREGLNESIYIAAMNPKNGDILAMTGQALNKDGEVSDDTLGIVQKNFVMGSSIKGATVLSAYMDGVLTTSNNVMVDEPLNFRSTQTISSLYNQYGRDVINDIEALEVSSNVYMAKLAMRMGGVWEYKPNDTLNINGKQLLDKQRHYYNQFGLGVETGIDLPSESTGYAGTVATPGEGLFQSFGQYDTYTPIQLLQYISTIANDGVRIAPRLVSEIRDTNPENGEVGSLKTEIPPKILNHIDVDETAMDRVQQGHYEVIHGNRGTARSVFAGAEYEAAGKTGTAQAWFWDDDLRRNTAEVVNMTFVGYAPYDDPEIAVAVVVPYLPARSSERSNRENTRAAKRVFDAYFKTGEFSQNVTEEAEEETEEIEDLMSDEADD